MRIILNILSTKNGICVVTALYISSCTHVHRHVTSFIKGQPEKKVSSLLSKFITSSLHSYKPPVTRASMCM